MRALHESSPQARRHFTRFGQVEQLVKASEADPDRGFMARLMMLCSLPRPAASIQQENTKELAAKGGLRSQPRPKPMTTEEDELRKLARHAKDLVTEIGMTFRRTLLSNPHLTALSLITNPVSESDFHSAHFLVHVRLRP